MTKRQLFAFTFRRSIPVLVSFVFVGAAYGVLIVEQGVTWYESLLMSVLIYSCSFQFVLTTLLVSGAPLITVALTSLLMNCRLPFYSLSMVAPFREMGARKLYMIHTLTDETFALNCSLELSGRNKRDVMFWTAFLARCALLLGTLVGSVAGQYAPFSLEGIDFCVTAMFVLIAIDQWGAAQNRMSAVVGACTALVFLLLLGADSFILPTLAVITVVLALTLTRKEKQEVQP